ncbi:hypothetical protein ANN_19535 [Periplaneta americana]|uniref:Uncharacterized protein n=1 Tax=Periplaneta americana TaxID=6978 RepID=A0ABQ8SB77_PERAM|nr:hypothetical protein ANN_19535 [Periplaneta americana]
MRPFKTFYSHEVELWLDNDQFQAVSFVEVGTIFGKAYLQAGSMQTAISGFRKCRIIPYTLTTFGDADFILDNTGHKETTPAAPFASATTQVAAATTKVTTATNEVAVATFQISAAKAKSLIQHPRLEGQTFSLQKEEIHLCHHSTFAHR